ncbi:ATP-dependent helicase [Desulfonispora thiosulfatigenes]|uniref:ATP-dependent helicase n=1 Tax=Desulfonispora thiosulfatigenes TaxID=83661 RepID=UPI0013563347|nr:ATP-dependent helicase [Desulfonispora thiosulfatigenes]
MSNKKRLNEQQLNILESLEGVNLVVAGPGTGKTTTIQYYLSKLVEVKGIKPEEILAVTFTNKAANEMKNRMKQMNIFNINISTIHSFAVSLLRKFSPPGYNRDFSIIDDGQGYMIIGGLIKELSIGEHPSYVLERLTLSRNLRNKEMLEKDGLKELYNRYMKILMNKNLMDYDGLLTWSQYVLAHNWQALEYYNQKISHVIVDEFQDVSPVQYDILYNLVKKNNNLLCVGDFDQAIFSFRGSDVSIMLNLEKDFPSLKTFYLEENYRSTQRLVKVANKLIRNNTIRRDKQLRSTREVGIGHAIKVFDSEKEEAKFIASVIKKGILEGMKYSDFAVLYRVHLVSRTFEEVFSAAAIPYQILGGVGFFARKEIMELLAFYKIILDKNDNSSFFQIVSLFKRCIGINGIDYNKGIIPNFIKELENEVKLEKIYDKIINDTGYLNFLKKDKSSEGERVLDNVEEFRSVVNSFDKKNTSIAEFLQFIDNTKVEEDTNSVKLMTVHTAKGLEYNNVFVVGTESSLFPHYNSESKDAIEEERRLFYVAMTRAKNRLVISYPKTKIYRGSTKKLKPSPFINEIGNGISFFDVLHKDNFLEVKKKPSISLVDKNNVVEGMVIKHPLFGKGKITSISEDPSKDTMVEVSFFSGETKLLLLELADLETI